jgi:hypothetical protein
MANSNHIARLYALILLLVPNICLGEVYLHIQAYHPTNRNLNNRTNGVGYRARGKIFGIYKNSYDDLSTYAVKQKRVGHGISVLYGAITGYRVPVLPVVGLQYDAKHFALTYTPPSKLSDAAVMLSLKYSP